jgi:type IV pilus assembly protein PilC
MKKFKYVARTEAGAQVKGVSEANTQAEAISSLRADGLVVESVQETDSTKDIQLNLGSKRIKEKTLGIMCGQFATILQSGLPIVRTLKLVSEQTEDKLLKNILSNVSDDVAAGYGLAGSFEKHGEELPATFIESVRAGEASGNLDVVFNRLSTYYQKTSRTKAKVKSAMIYPIFVLVVAVVVIAIIMIFAIPTFKSTFTSMGESLPWVTQFMIDSSDFWSNNALYIVIIIGAAVLAVKYFKKRNDNFHLKWSEWGTKIPIIGRINVMSAASQYASTMSVMLAAGLSVVRAVEATANTLSNYWLAQKLDGTRGNLESGKPLAESLDKTGAYPQLVVEMTGVGEDTGTLEHTLEVLADYYDNEVATATERALSIMEPTIIVILAVVVCFILLAVYLPIFSIYGGITS